MNPQPACPASPAPTPERRRAFYARFIRPGALVFDVGANLGDRTADFLALGARVIAVEPQPRLARRLRERFGLAAPQEPDPTAAPGRVCVVEAALGAEPGRAELITASYHTVASLSPAWIDRVSASGRFPDIRWGATISVAVETCDRLIAAHGLPEFMKIDVEGFEDRVLAGLSRPVPAVCFEFTPEHTPCAEACLQRLDALAHLAGGTYRYNLGLGEHDDLALPQWVDGDALARHLRRFEGDRVTFGDVYARLAMP